MRFINLFQLKSFISFYLTSKTVNSIHSPFVFDLLMNTLEDERQYYGLVEMAVIREYLLHDERLVEIDDHGAGSKVNASRKRKISQITSTAVSSESQAHFLFRLVNYLKPTTILELGTSIGLSSLYMHKARKQAQIHTVEGSPALYGIAKTLHANSGADIHIHSGTFQQVLPKLLADIGEIDLVYIDGNHTYEATIWHHELLKPYLSDDAVMIYDDIYWSKGMNEAWSKIKADGEFSICLDLFDFGIIIKNKDQTTRQNERIIKRSRKPLNLGLFG